MDIKGKLVQQLPIEQGTSKDGKEWKKRMMIFDIPSGSYTDKLAVTFFGNNADATLKIGLEYLLSLNVKSRESYGRWYTEATIWKFSVVDGAANEAADHAGVNNTSVTTTKPNSTTTTMIPDDNNDLPF